MSAAGGDRMNEAARLLAAMVSRARLEQERAASSPAGSASPAETRGDFSKDAA